jgi:hypothetical protein
VSNAICQKTSAESVAFFVSRDVPAAQIEERYTVTGDVFAGHDERAVIVQL